MRVALQCYYVGSLPVGPFGWWVSPWLVLVTPSGGAFFCPGATPALAGLHSPKIVSQNVPVVKGLSGQYQKLDKKSSLCYHQSMMNGKLKRLRERKLLTQVELAQMAGLTAVTISRIETGTHKPMFSTVKKLAAALGVPPEKLIERPRERSAHNG